jgi:N-methylhydantoinase A
VIPYAAGNFSAVGLLLCPLRWDTSVMVLKPAEEVSKDDLERSLKALDEEARGKMRETGAKAADLVSTWIAHMRYAGQSYDLSVDLGEPWTGKLPKDIVARLKTAFHDHHERHYAYRSEDEVIEIVQLRLSVRAPETDFPKPAEMGKQAIKKGEREVYFTGPSHWSEAMVWDRASLPEHHEILGPAVIEGEGSSALIPPGWEARVDEWRNLVVTRMD